MLQILLPMRGSAVTTAPSPTSNPPILIGLRAIQNPPPEGDSRLGATRYIIWVHSDNRWYYHSIRCNTLQHQTPSLHPATVNSYYMQHTATHRNTLQHTATHCNTLQHKTIQFRAWWIRMTAHTICTKLDNFVLQCVAVCCSVLQCVAVCYSVLQRVAACCSVLQCVAVCMCCSVNMTNPHDRARNMKSLVRHAIVCHHTMILSKIR